MQQHITHAAGRPVSSGVCLCTVTHSTSEHDLCCTSLYLSLESHDILASLILADVVLDGAYPGGVCQRVGALINVVVSGRHIDKHERLGTASKRVTHQHSQLVIPAVIYIQSADMSPADLLCHLCSHAKADRQSWAAYGCRGSHHEADGIDFACPCERQTGSQAGRTTVWPLGINPQHDRCSIAAQMVRHSVPQMSTSTVSPGFPDHSNSGRHCMACLCRVV